MSEDTSNALGLEFSQLTVEDDKTEEKQAAAKTPEPEVVQIQWDDAPVKKEKPYFNPERVKTGGAQRDKITNEELEAKMARMREQNEKIKQRRLDVQADEDAFRKIQEVDKAKLVHSRKVQAEIDRARDQNAKRKMEKVQNREWDSGKGAADRSRPPPVRSEYASLRQKPKPRPQSSQTGSQSKLNEDLWQPLPEPGAQPTKEETPPEPSSSQLQAPEVQAAIPVNWTNEATDWGSTGMNDSWAALIAEEALKNPVNPAGANPVDPAAAPSEPSATSEWLPGWDQTTPAPSSTERGRGRGRGRGDRGRGGRGRGARGARGGRGRGGGDRGGEQGGGDRGGDKGDKGDKGGDAQPDVAPQVAPAGEADWFQPAW